MYKVLLFGLILFTAVGIYLKTLDTERNRYVNIGTSVPLSGHLKEIGNSIVFGAKSYFTFVNDKKILDNIQINFTYLDDKYEPEITNTNTRTLLDNEDIFAFFSFVGTPTVKNILPIVREEKIPFVAPFTGAMFIRNSENNFIINFRKSYYDEISATIKYLHNTQGLRRFAVFYQNDDYGEEGYLATLKALRKEKITLLGEGTYKRNTLSIRHSFFEIMNRAPEVVIMVGAYKPNAHFIKRARENGFNNTVFVIPSFSDADTLIKELDYNTQNLLFSQVLPSYTDTSIPQVREYQEIMKKYAPETSLGFVSFESFLGAKILTDAIKYSRDLSKREFLQSMDKISKTSEELKLFRRVYLFQYKDSAFVEVGK